MSTPDRSDLLRVWEQGVGESPALRGLLLMQAAAPQADREALARCSIGQRDHLLLNLRDTLFGPEIHCLTECVHCGESIEVDFEIDSIRVPHGESGRTYRTSAEGYDVQFRLPDSNDLLALRGEQPARAERRLLERCVVSVKRNEGDAAVAELPDAVVRAIGDEMGEVDRQAEVVLNVVCPTCAAVWPAPFDIVAHLWEELDAWARRMLREVHALAMVYGWGEAEILRMSGARRRAYLELIDA